MINFLIGMLAGIVTASIFFAIFWIGSKKHPSKINGYLNMENGKMVLKFTEVDFTKDEYVIFKLDQEIRKNCIDNDETI